MWQVSESDKDPPPLIEEDTDGWRETRLAYGLKSDVTYLRVSFVLQVEQEKQVTHQALLRAETTEVTTDHNYHNLHTMCRLDTKKGTLISLTISLNHPVAVIAHVAKELGLEKYTIYIKYKFKKKKFTLTIEDLLLSFSYLVIMGFTVGQPLPLIMAMAQERLLTLGAHKMLKKDFFKNHLFIRVYK